MYLVVHFHAFIGLFFLVCFVYSCLFKKLLLRSSYFLNKLLVFLHVVEILSYCHICMWQWTNIFPLSFFDFRFCIWYFDLKHFSCFHFFPLKFLKLFSWLKSYSPFTKEVDIFPSNYYFLFNNLYERHTDTNFRIFFSKIDHFSNIKPWRILFIYLVLSLLP